MVQLSLQGDVECMTPDAQRSLCSMSQLKRLELWVQGIASRHLQPISTLLALRHLIVGSRSPGEAIPYPSLSIADVSALFCLTRLTTLELWAVGRNKPERIFADSGSLQGGPGSFSRPEAVADACLQPSKLPAGRCDAGGVAAPHAAPQPGSFRDRSVNLACWPLAIASESPAPAAEPADRV